LDRLELDARPGCDFLRGLTGVEGHQFTEDALRAADSRVAVASVA
jgi:hypothetical protein